MKYLRLIKWRLSLAVAFSATAGYFLATQEFDFRALVCFFGVFLLAGGAAALNQIQERHLDRQMDRTAQRPLPAKELDFMQAISFTLLCILTGSILLFKLSWIAGLLGLLNVVIYNALYTPLKRVSIYAVLPGGLVGAIPPIIGWTAAGSHIDNPEILFLATLVFLWQIPHFWLLVMRYGKEYEGAGFKSISQYLDERQIKRLVFFWILISSAFLATYQLFGINLSYWIGGIVILLNIVFILAFYWFLFKVKDPAKIKIAFILTNLFLSLVLALLIINSLF